MQISNIVKNSLNFFVSNQHTCIFVVAIDKSDNNNTVKNIGCKIGESIGGIVHDISNDSYYYNCFDYLYLGTIPLSVKVKLNDTFNWSTFVPLCEKIIKKYLDKNQKKKLKNFLSRFDDSYDIVYLQMIDVNS